VPVERTDPDPSDAEHPVDLSDLGPDVAAQDLGLASRAMSLAVAAQDPVERRFLASLARALRGGELSLPPMPRAVLRIQKLLDSASCHIAELSQEIEVDAALAARLVGIANSAFYQGMGPVRSAGDAVVRIGLGETRYIVWAITLRSKVFRVPGRREEIERLWRHGVAASSAAQIIGAAAGLEPDTCFISGLLHDLGRVSLYSLAGEHPRDGMVSPDAFRRIDAELHAPLGAVAAETWNIGSEISGAIAHHHDPSAAPLASRPLAWVVRAADLLAHCIVGEEPEVFGDDSAENLWCGALAELGLEASDGSELHAEALEAFGVRAKGLL